ncbi:creatininase family protein [Aneurinibacillus sp. BA2021]|nr:creatininase family protein [Aneurinibacillus sp. BA2021]
MNIYDLQRMTWPEIKEAFTQAKLGIIPIGAHEQHGPHMVESCDAVLAKRMADRLAARLHPAAFVAPAITMGVSPHHLNFPGTISLQPETLISLLRDMTVSLRHHGITTFLWLNAHGGNQSTLSIACQKLSIELDVTIYYAKTTASAGEVYKEHITSSPYGHSCEREVSEAYYLAPELIREDRLQKGQLQPHPRWRHLRPGKPLQGFYRYEEMTANGCIGDGTQASYELGEKIVETALDRLEEELRYLIEVEQSSYNL